ncbi:sugar ABC transporter substrate-binding protein [Butyricicoccus porcorum]|uniref:sugar ABC transporter substrate-binding protein n=1 Tax=Butyricicoccus porcorum TaxID=1945634 RepID=UPI0013FD1759|nr:substrate-binding domain-containing protein [Butyricicoccus porcorum]
MSFIPADGIIIRSDASQEVNDLIAEAKEQDIPVVSVIDDYSGQTQDYVGVSSYDVGQAYGQLVLDLQKTDEVQKVTILQTAEDSENTIRSVEASLLEVLPDEIALDRKIIEGSDTFSIEENIQDFILSEDAPDVLICMSTVSAICAYHIVVDCNRVGDIQLLVNYATGEILDAIEKGGIFASVSLDTQKLGSSCVQCLDDLVCEGKKSSYRSIPLKVITIDNVAEYRSTLEGTQ